MRWWWLCVCASCYATVDWSTDDGPPITFVDGVTPRNLLVLSVDTTRRDQLGYFSGNGTTPNFDIFLDEAVVLADHHSCSNWTAPSMACVATGLTQMEHGFASWNSNPGVPAMPGPNYVSNTLAKLMSNTGYQTRLITANAVFGPWFTEVGVGFDEAINLDYQSAESVAATALLEISELSANEAPWYAHVHFMDPHGPYCAPDEYVNFALLDPFGLSVAEVCADSYTYGGGWYAMSPEVQDTTYTAYMELYHAELRYWDETFGTLWASLEAMGALDDTLVVFVTDHGQQFFERGGHGHGLYLGAEENRSTAAFWAKTLPPQVWMEPTIHQDVHATLNEVYGLIPPRVRSGYTIGTAPPDRAIRTINYWGGAVELAVIRNRQQLNYSFDGRRAFYRYDTDPEGLIDTYDPADPDVIALWTEMDAWIADVLRFWPNVSPPYEQGP